MAHHIDIGFFILRQRRCDLVERVAETSVNIRAVDAEGHFRWHIEHKIIAFTSDVNTCAGRLLPQFLFLLIHIISGACTRQGTNTSPDDLFCTIALAAD